MTRVGVIGLGNIGRPLAERLLEAGHRVVGHTRRPALVSDLFERGVEPASSPHRVAERCEVVLTALPFPTTVEEVYLGSDGLRDAARPGLQLIDHSTVGPALSRRLAAALAEVGAEFLDAPVSGGPEAARAGTLAIMVGGSAAAFETALPLLRELGSRIAHCGPPGSGSTVKMINQLLVGIHSVATAEAVRLAERSGVDPAQALELIGGGLGSSAILGRNGPRTLQGEFAAGARIDLFVKDAALVVELCEAAGLEVRLFREARRAFERAFELGGGAFDLAAVVAAVDGAAVWEREPAAPGRV